MGKAKTVLFNSVFDKRKHTQERVMENKQLKYKKAILFVLSFSWMNISYAELALTCEQSKTFQPTLSSRQGSNARKFHQNEKQYALSVGNGQYRSEAEIISFFRKLKKIEAISKNCGIPSEEISPEKYYELTGEKF